MATDPTPAPDGILIEPDAPGTATKPRHGERAAQIRKMALRYPELSNRQIAKRVGCNPANVDQIMRRFLGKEPTEDLAAFRSNKPDILEAVQLRTLASITDADISNASYLQRVTGFAILQDKVSLMRGQPTSIHVHALVDVLDALRRRDQE